MDLVLIKLTLSEIMPKRQKREIIEIGTLRKWIAMVKMNKNNNKQFTISSKLFNEVKFPTDNLKNVVFNEETILRKHRLRLLRFKLRNLLDTIFLTKPKIFLHKNFKRKTILVLSDLRDISTFKILFPNDLLVVYIKYLMINGKCDLYKTRANK